jgi:methylase of polypeptide subunit release factors
VLELEHHLFFLTFGGKLALAPVGDQLHRVLDVGTGTGHWAIDFAEEHPEAEVRSKPQSSC